MITNIKTSVSFPEIGRIRKGAPKQKKVNAQGREVSTVGADLQDRFRVVFAAGQDESVARFVAKYGDLQPKEITIMLPFASVEAVWDASYTAYNAGRLVARADGEKYIYKVDPATGQVEVKDGEPFTPFHHGDRITYERAERTFTLPIRPTGMLKVFIPDLARLVQLTLVTTSIYDCINITRQLNAVQLLAGALNNGSVAGIPLILSRRPQEITWVKETGDATRITKWLVNVEAHPDWVKAAVSRLRTVSLPGGTMHGAPLLPVETDIITDVDPDQEEWEEDESVEGDWVEPQLRPATPEPPVEARTATTGEPAGPAPSGKTLPGLDETGPYKLTYRTAFKAASHEGNPYRNMPTEKLVVRVNTMLKNPQRSEDEQFKLDCIRTILHFRNLEGATHAKPG